MGKNGGGSRRSGERVGFTTSIPIEILYAAGRIPVDLNNLFITSPDRREWVEAADLAGYPKNICTWIKGIYGAVLRNGVREVIAVTRGDCSNTQALMETLEVAGVRIIPFAYPYDRDPEALRYQIEKLCSYFSVPLRSAERTRRELAGVRAKLRRIDELTWADGRVTGRENHEILVSSSDMTGDPAAFERRAEALLAEAERRDPCPPGVRVGFIGVPPIFSDLHSFVESRGAQVVYNETQRQFSMPFEAGDLVDQYLQYTYPYNVFVRIEDIAAEVERRRIWGLVHYVQSFCFRQIEDLIFRDRLPVPILTLEGEGPGPLDARSRVRIEAYLEFLAAGREGR